MGFAVALVLVLLPFLAAEDSAQIVVYLSWDSPQRGRQTVFCDGARMAEVQAGRFFVINVEPGRHVLIAGDGIPTTVDVPAKGESFVRVGREIEIGPSGKTSIPVLEDLSPEQARLDMINLVYVSPKKIFSTSVSEGDPFLQQRPKLKTRNGVQ
jgi:hypothetical protein